MAAQSEDALASNLGDNVDWDTFEQILALDSSEEERDFSKDLVYDFFTQAEATFQEMDSNLQVPLENKNLKKLSDLGHFLKGSSGTLGLVKVSGSCEKIQNFGKNMDETGNETGVSDETSLENIRRTIEQAKSEFREVEPALRRFYGE